MRSRLLIIFAALVIGSVAALLVFSYLNAAQSRMRADAQPVQVLVAKKEIPKGTPIDEVLSKKLAELDPVPRRYVADGAISSARAVTGQVVANAMTKGEQLTSSDFQLPSEAGLAYNVPPDFIALSLPTDQFRGVAGFVKPGDSVAIVGTIWITNEEKTTTRILVPRARVLAVRQDVGAGDRQQEQARSSSGAFSGQNNQQGQAQPYYSVTLAMSRPDAERVVLVQEKGKVWLALLGGTMTASTPAPTGGQNFGTVLSYERNAGLR